MTQKTKETISKFEFSFLAGLNETEEEKAKKTVRNFVTRSIIECKSAISKLENGNIANLVFDLALAEEKLTEAHNEFEQCRFYPKSDFLTYCKARNNTKQAIELARGLVIDISDKITELKYQVEEFKVILKDLKATTKV